MLHPIFSTLVTRPDLIVDHLSGYTALLGEETKSVGTELVVKAMAWVMMGLMLMLCLTLAGTAVMLGVMHGHFHWALAAVPGVALLLALVAFVLARKPLSGGHYAEFKSQIESDVATLRAAGGHHGR
ncbi:hypothetical protein RD110_16275 [Rhodoferax koreense]|uniref:Phage holin family protein n=1 Tax=Rhodoferax koreensis TaxID=1842727 RepID=A0A1P8JXS2_9BURK|nr:hypothetical protein [Rhodoferax koreense]APW38564.1 hypothetical protein RD110_16275 [Rhodoferax koreense]